ncbi:uncharacterized protein PGTG_12598 [Puccinia graminis f. sp. tritici CRL 75-36-700-3]|uniref:Uncharacterized protein n=1 Tax=Puccinia graminis f. sp. tritici (strain CRL 75-36-700-3 / race SCCL) TaxID=418459 RepID=E3KUU1_PUCGT|nr:uncharacterized protein PGTG_12598 [Puccinia graminis f. sp. tritici CRL 75-36-700-3]EFP88151.2 hypothetical protein PGTG_12598 [Puccinia graminis f. sp. tritici CRL 75-36-700-3]
MSAKSSSNNTQFVYHEDDRLIQTIVAPCLGDLGHNLTSGLKYKVKGAIVRDDACGTTWEFNPLMLKLSTKSGHLTVSGTGRVNAINLGMDAGKDKPLQDEVLVNHQPLLRLIIPKHNSSSIDWTAIQKGSALEFSGQFIGEEPDSGVIRLLIEPSL